MFRKVLSTSCSLCIVIGFLTLLGTVGSFELNSIDFKTAIVQAGIGMVLTYAGYMGLKTIDPSFFS